MQTIDFKKRNESRRERGKKEGISRSGERMRG
jgi:hypothetical protein